MKGLWGVLVVSGACYTLIMAIASEITSPLIGAILLAPVTAGWTGICLGAVRKESINWKMLFSRFDGYGRFAWGVGRVTLFTILWGLLLIIPGIIASLRYSLFMFLMLDEPDLEAKAAMEKSAELIKGYKWRYFGYSLLLFFIFLVPTVVTLGIGIIWIFPFMHCFHVHFYLSLRAEKGLPDLAIPEELPLLPPPAQE